MRIFTKEELVGKDVSTIEGAFIVADKVTERQGFVYGEGFFFDKKGKQIVLTKIQQKLLETLLEADDYLSNDELNAAVWDGEASVFSIRNFIKKLRDVTNKSFIDGKSNIGYRIKK